MGRLGSGKGLTTAQLATLLAPFGIRSRQLKIDGKNRNGYESKQFADAFTRTLPPEASLPLYLAIQNKGLRRYTRVYRNRPVELSKRHLTPLIPTQVDG